MIGILGLGSYLPSSIRTNDWWPPELVASWMEMRAKRPPPPVPADPSEGTRRVMAAMREQAPDPFQGTRERRIASSTESVFDLEEQAARAAIARAEIDPRSIDALLSYTVVPDVLLSNSASVLHHRLGLSTACLSLQADAATYSFLAQLALAEGLIAAGRAKVVLLVQSSISTRLIDREDPGSVLCGDGAAAVIVGKVSGNRGILGSVHFTDGRFPNSLVMSVPGGTWMDAGRPRLHVADPRQLHEVFLATADVCRSSVEAVLAQTGHTAGDVQFSCVHQGTAWLQQVVNSYSGLGSARSVETFSRYGYLFAAMIPTNLDVAERERQVCDDDLVLLAGGGTGMTYGATLLRWGR